MMMIMLIIKKKKKKKMMMMMMMMMMTRVPRGMIIHQDRREPCCANKVATGFTQTTELNPKR